MPTGPLQHGGLGARGAKALRCHSPARSPLPVLRAHAERATWSAMHGQRRSIFGGLSVLSAPGGRPRGLGRQKRVRDEELSPGRPVPQEASSAGRGRTGGGGRGPGGRRPMLYPYSCARRSSIRRRAADPPRRGGAGAWIKEKPASGKRAFCCPCPGPPLGAQSAGQQHHGDRKP